MEYFAQVLRQKGGRIQETGTRRKTQGFWVDLLCCDEKILGDGVTWGMSTGEFVMSKCYKLMEGVGRAART